MSLADLYRTKPELTFRELDWMVKARRRDAWDHTAALRAHLANMFRGKGESVVHPWRFHPMRQNERTAAEKPPVTVQQLTLAFVGL